MLGASRGFVDAWISQTRDRKLSLEGKAADDALIQRRLAEAIWNIDVTVTRLRADIGELWQMAQDRAPVPMQLKAQVRWNMNHGCDLVAQAINDLFRRPLDARCSSITRYNSAFKTSRRQWHTRTCLRIRSQKRWADISWERRSPNLSSEGAYLDRAIACIEDYTDESRHSALWERQRHMTLDEIAMRAGVAKSTFYNLPELTYAT